MTPQFLSDLLRWIYSILSWPGDVLNTFDNFNLISGKIGGLQIFSELSPEIRFQFISWYTLELLVYVGFLPEYVIRSIDESVLII